MKIYMSHGSQQKPLIREIKKNFPNHLSAWLDEDDFLIGDNLAKTFETAIKLEVDYVLLFMDSIAAQSKWVRQELTWALEKENELKRNFLLPVIIGSIDIESTIPEFAERKYITISNYTEKDIQNAANEIVSGIFALICRDLERFHNPKPVKAYQAIDKADNILTEVASIVRKAVFPHRINNPLPVDKLLEIIKEHIHDIEFLHEFEDILERITHRNLIPGLSYDGFELYLIEEHSLWKSQLNHDQKVNVARKASSFIKNGMNIYIDAGSTTEEIVKIICKKIETRALTKISITTPSVKLANLISDCCVSMGFDDDFSAVQLFVLGGIVRPSTQAIVPITDIHFMDSIAKYTGGFDLAFLGANGIHTEEGLTTHGNSEVSGKRHALELSKKSIFVCDDTKCGIVLPYTIADFSNDIIVIINNNPLNEQLSDLVSKHDQKIILV